MFRFADPWWFAVLLPAAILTAWAVRRRTRWIARVRLPGTSTAVESEASSTSST